MEAQLKKMKAEKWKYFKIIKISQTLNLILKLIN